MPIPSLETLNPTFYSQYIRQNEGSSLGSVNATIDSKSLIYHCQAAELAIWIHEHDVENHPYLYHFYVIYLFGLVIDGEITESRNLANRVIQLSQRPRFKQLLRSRELNLAVQFVFAVSDWNLQKIWEILNDDNNVKFEDFAAKQERDSKNVSQNIEGPDQDSDPSVNIWHSNPIFTSLIYTLKKNLLNTIIATIIKSYTSIRITTVQKLLFLKRLDNSDILTLLNSVVPGWRIDDDENSNEVVIPPSERDVKIIYMGNNPPDGSFKYYKRIYNIEFASITTSAKEKGNTLHVDSQISQLVQISKRLAQ